MAASQTSVGFHFSFQAFQQYRNRQNETTLDNLLENIGEGLRKDHIMLTVLV